VQLEQFNLDGLRELAQQQELDIRETREILIDRLTDFFERQGWPEQIRIAGPNAPESDTPVLGEDGAGASATRIIKSQQASRSAGRNLMQQGNQAINVQEIIQAVVQALETGRIQSGETSGNREYAQRPQTPSLLGNGSWRITGIKSNSQPN